VVTFDGAQYSMQGVGEYVAARHDDIEVQVRTVALGDVASGVAAVAIRVGDHRISITEPTGDDGSWVRVDGAPATATFTQVGDAMLRQERHSVSVTTPDGTFVRVQGSVPDVFTVRIEPAGAGWTGLLGDNDGEAENDLQTRDGVIFDAVDASAEDIHSTFSESWRVSDAESLFEYAAGQSTATFTDRSHPRATLDLASVPATQLAMAERLCIASGIVDDAVFDWCVFDMLVMGDLGTLRTPAALGVIRNIRSIDAVVAASQGQLVRRADGTFEDQRFAPQRIIHGTHDTDAHAPEDPQADASSWEVTAWTLLGSNRNSIVCAPGGEPHPVWGGHDVYATESSVCTAAVHAGVISFTEGGAVTIDPLDQGEGDRYQDAGALPGYAQNGVTSQSVWAGRAFTIRHE
ncbi:MAG: hypothetical protein GX539_04605, partial [Candidatus Cloacimonetes bacterium]|nr:hypothetical protein [Candidatus Cloacimonadota bacterium]